MSQIVVQRRVFPTSGEGWDSMEHAVKSYSHSRARDWKAKEQEERFSANSHPLKEVEEWNHFHGWTKWNRTWEMWDKSRKNLSHKGRRTCSVCCVVVRTNEELVGGTLLTNYSRVDCSGKNEGRNNIIHLWNILHHFGLFEYSFCQIDSIIVDTFSERMITWMGTNGRNIPRSRIRVGSSVERGPRQFVIGSTSGRKTGH